MIQTQITLQNTARSQAGGISVAGYIRDSVGVSANPMRVLGCYALVLILAGGGVYADRQRGRVKVSAGDLLLILPDVPHAYGPPIENGVRGRWDEFYVVFDGSIFDAWRTAGLLAKAGPQRRLRPIEYWQRRLVAAAGSTADTGPAAGLAAACRVQQFLVDALLGVHEDERDWLDRAKAAFDAAAQNPKPRSETDVVRDVAVEAGLSYETFRKRFARQIGVSPGRYYNAAVIDHAVRRLTAGETLADIAAALGFCDAFHFSKRFKQHVGVSPDDFRRRMSAK